jgi:hypothetical protein
MWIDRIRTGDPATSVGSGVVTGVGVSVGVTGCAVGEGVRVAGRGEGA